MPLNKEVFRVRALSAVVFVAIMLTGLLWNVWSFLVLFTLIHIGCWWEYSRLVQQISQNRLHSWITLGFISLGLAVMLGFCGSVYAWQGYMLRSNLVFPFSLAGFILLVMGILHRQSQVTPKGFAQLGLGIIYISLSWGMMLGLRQYGAQDLHTDRGWMVPMLLIGAIWLNDTMAYIVGSLVGKTPLSPISPKKTWEGTIGGALLAIIFMACIARFAWGTAWLFAIAIPAIAAVAGTLGDLLESKLKRLAGVKDSGQMMPGHGGFLDRFDSMLLATPFVWLFVVLFG